MLEQDKLGASFVRGKLQEVKARGRRFAVRIDARADELEFDHVVVRHGTDSAIARDFPDIAELHTRAIAGGGEIDDAAVAEALAFFDTPPPATLRPIAHSLSDDVRELAALAQWTITTPEVIATIRRLEPNADWSSPPGPPVPPRELLARALAEVLQRRIPMVPLGESDIRRLHTLVRLERIAGERDAAFDLFFTRVRGDAHRSVYEYGLYAEDRALVEQLLASWPEPKLKRARLLNSAGYADIALGELNRSCTSLKEAIQIRHEHGDFEQEAVSRTNLAEALYLMGQDDPASEQIDEAVRLISRTSHLGLFRNARSREALQSTSARAEAIAAELWRLPDPPANNVYETVLANLSDVRLFGALMRHATSEWSQALANEALRYFGFTGPQRRPRLVALDRAVVDFFAAALSHSYGLGVRSCPTLGEALWQVEQAGDRMWQARCELCAHRLDPTSFQTPKISDEAVALKNLAGGAPALHALMV